MQFNITACKISQASQPGYTYSGLMLISGEFSIFDTGQEQLIRRQLTEERYH